MADFSLIEFAVYGGIAYTGIVVLIISILLNPPTSRSLAGARSVWLTPSILCMGLLMFASGNITTEYTDSTVTNLGYNATNSTQLISNSTLTTTETNKYILVDPVWGAVHMGLFTNMIIYVLIQILQILTKPE